MNFWKFDLVTVSSLLVSYAVCAYLTIPSSQLLESKPKIVPPKTLNNLTLGFRHVIADSLWLRVLQADDFCESPDPKARFNRGISLEDAMKDKLSPSRCHKGWVYQMLDIITDLDPRFRRVYRMGGIQLSIAVDDREGARLIFEKGIANDFEDWQLLYTAAYHYIFEVQNAERARQILQLATLIPNVPFIVKILASKLDDYTGRKQLAIDTLTEYLKTAKRGTEGYAHASGRLAQLLQQKDLEKNEEKNKSKKQKNN